MELHTKEAVHLREEHYRALIHALSAIVWTTDAGGQVIEDQPQWRAFTGQTSNEIQGCGWLAALHPDSRAEAVSDWRHGVAQGSPYQTEWRLRRWDGEYRCFSIHAAPVRARDGAVREWIGCNIDITEYKVRDEELSRLQTKAVADLAKMERYGRKMQILKNLGDTLQACNSREEAYPFIALAATELFPGAGGALAVPAAGLRGLFETAIEWGGVRDQPIANGAWMKADFAIDDCWALRRGGLHEPGQGTVCQHFKTESAGPFACLPLAVRGEVLGLLSIRLARSERLDEEGRSVLSTFGNALAPGLSTLQLREALHESPVRGRA